MSEEVLTFWDSWESIRAFAGEPIDKAKYYEHDFGFLIDPPAGVEHFEVLDAAPGVQARLHRE